MTWLEIAALAAVLIGLGGGAFLVAQRPTFWIGLGLEVVKRVLPHLKGLETPGEMRRRHREGRERNER